MLSVMLFENVLWFTFLLYFFLESSSGLLHMTSPIPSMYELIVFAGISLYTRATIIPLQFQISSYLTLIFLYIFDCSFITTYSNGILLSKVEIILILHLYCLLYRMELGLEAVRRILET
jgi:hypothetical protein